VAHGPWRIDTGVAIWIVFCVTLVCGMAVAIPAPVLPLRLRILRAAPSRLILELGAIVATVALVRLACKSVPAFTRAPPPVGFAIFTAFLVPAVLAMYVGLIRGLERRPVVELALHGALRELGVGLLYGAGLFSATIGVIALLGGYHVEGTEPPLVLLGSVAMGVQSGFVEEIITRGIIFRLLDEWLGTWAALGISSALFGLFHIANPHATAWSAVAIALEAGTLLAAAYLLTRRLWMPIGLHAAWNYTQGAIFGVAVSGSRVKGLLHGSVTGPAWLSGGEFGAEASVVAVLSCFLLAAWFLFRVVQAGGTKAPSWVRAKPASAVSDARCT
jgi:membrane protease YdiL (CAAX protease family)